MFLVTVKSMLVYKIVNEFRKIFRRILTLTEFKSSSGRIVFFSRPNVKVLYKHIPTNDPSEGINNFHSLLFAWSFLIIYFPH